MAQPSSSNAGKRHHDLPNGAGYGARTDLQQKEAGDDARSATSATHDTGRPTVRASSTTSTATTRDISNATSTMNHASDADSVVGQPELLGKDLLHSLPAYAPSQKPVNREELELQASALEMRKAMKAKKPLIKWQRICSKQHRVRLDLPEKRTFLSQEPAYNQFKQEKSLKLLNYGHLVLRTDPGIRQTGQCFDEHLFFLRQVVENCNSLKKAGHAVGTLGIELPLPLLRPGLMHDYEISMVKLQLKIFLETIQTDKVIVSLGLSGMRSEWFGQDMLGNYFASLATNTQLEVLDLSNAELGDADGCALAAALEKNRSIKTVYFKGCTMPEKGKLALALLLEQRWSVNERSQSFEARPSSPGATDTSNALHESS